MIEIETIEAIKTSVVEMQALLDDLATELQEEENRSDELEELSEAYEELEAESDASRAATRALLRELEFAADAATRKKDAVELQNELRCIALKCKHTLNSL